MPTWHSLLQEIKARGSTFDVIRRERLKTLSKVTRRNVVSNHAKLTPVIM